MRLSIIAAVARNGVIGKDGDLPWRLRADLRRFKRLTMGSALVMGRKTWESIGRPLPGRLSIVLTRRADFEVPSGVEVAHGVDEALRKARDAGFGETFVIGGAAIYALALERADRLHLTEVEAEVEGDVFFPDFERRAFDVVEEERVPADEHNEYPTTYRLLVRR